MYVKQNRRIEEGRVDPSVGGEHPSDGSREDMVWKSLFNKFCPSGELDATTLVTMCRELNIINKRLTSTGVRLVYKRTRAICMAPGCNQQYKDGLIYKKRVNYVVFRDVLIPLLLQRRKMDMEDFTVMVTKFMSCNPHIVQRQRTFDIVKACF